MEIFKRHIGREEKRKREMEFYLQELENTVGEDSTTKERDAYRIQTALENSGRSIRCKNKPK